jgi:hypothetical protein
MSFAGDFWSPFGARPYVAAVLLLGFLLIIARPKSDERPELIGFFGVLWPILFLLPTHNLVYTPRHLYISFAGIAVAFGLSLARSNGGRLTRLALFVGGGTVLALAPETLASVERYTRMSDRCRLALSTIAKGAESLPEGDVLVLVGMPAHESAPWGFGWSLAEALRPPFVEEPIDSRLEVVYRRQWRPEAWAAYRARYGSRGLHVLAWNPAFNGIEFLRSSDIGSLEER